MRHLYSLLLYLLTPFVLLKLVVRGFRSPRYWRRWGERFALSLPTIPPDCIWVHAVSVGEARAAIPLIQELSKRYADKAILVTCVTPTGSETITEEFGQRVLHCYLPYDLPGNVNRFIRHAQPVLGIIMETEIWPNLYHACHTHKVPIIIANARLSERSLAGYKRIHGLVKSTLETVSIISAQSERDANHFQQLGVRDEQIQKTGNIKFDASVPASIQEQSSALRRLLGEHRPIWIAASTHEGEDEIILSAFRGVKKRFKNCLLLLVPRHPERFTRVTALSKRYKFNTVCRSENIPCTDDTDVFVGDSMGEMMLLYAASDLALVGGSLVETGGHNMLEPASLGMPIIFGPHVFNFAEISETLLKAGAARQVSDEQDLEDTVCALLSDPEYRTTIGEKARATVDQNRGALDRLLDIVAQQLKH